MLRKYVIENQVSFSDTLDYVVRQCTLEGGQQIEKEIKCIINEISKLGQTQIIHCKSLDDYFKVITYIQQLQQMLQTVAKPFDKYMSLKNKSNFISTLFSQTLNLIFNNFKSDICNYIVIDQASLAEIVVIIKFFNKLEGEAQQQQVIFQVEVLSQLKKTIQQHLECIELQNNTVYRINLTLFFLLKFIQDSCLDNLIFLQLRDQILKFCKKPQIQLKFRQQFEKSFDVYLNNDDKDKIISYSKLNMYQNDLNLTLFDYVAVKFITQIYTLCDLNVTEEFQQIFTNKMSSFVLKQDQIYLQIKNLKLFCDQTLINSNKFYQMVKSFIKINNDVFLVNYLLQQEYQPDLTILLDFMQNPDYLIQNIVFQYMYFDTKRVFIKQLTCDIKQHYILDVGEFLEEIYQTLDINQFQIHIENANRGQLDLSNIVVDKTILCKDDFRKYQIKTYIGVCKMAIDDTIVCTLPLYAKCLQTIFTQDLEKASSIFGTSVVQQTLQSYQKWKNNKVPVMEIFQSLSIQQNDGKQEDTVKQNMISLQTQIVKYLKINKQTTIDEVQIKYNLQPNHLKQIIEYLIKTEIVQQNNSILQYIE